MKDGVIELTVRTWVVSKKNQLEFTGPNRRPHYKPAARASMAEVERQLAAQWSGKPLEHPAVCFVYFSPSDRFDRDGAETTLIDALVKVGVLVDDNVKHFNGWVVSAACVRTSSEYGAKVFLEPTNDLDALLRHVRGGNALTASTLESVEVGRGWRRV